MLRFVADENFNNNIVRGLLRRQPELDLGKYQLYLQGIRQWKTPLLEYLRR